MIARKSLFKAVTLAALVLAVLGGAAWFYTAPPSTVEVENLYVDAGAGRNEQALARLLAIAESGRVEAQRMAGEILVLQRDATSVAAGMAWLQRAESAGDADAAFLLGKLGFRGESGLKPDYVTAREHLLRAAGLGHDGAGYYLGLIYKNGYGVTADAAEAVRWFARAADGNPIARFMLANAYRYGDGVARDMDRARELYESAAEDDSPEAVQTLAMAYRDGELGITRDEMQHRHYVLETAHVLKHPASAP